MSDPRPCPARGVACTWAITARAYSRSSRRQTSPLLLGDCNVRCKTHFAPKLLGGKRAHSVALYTTKASYLGVPAPVRLGQTTSVVLAYQEFHVKRRRGETQSPLGSCTLGGTAETRVGALMKRPLAAQISAKHSSTRSSLDARFHTLPTGRARVFHACRASETGMVTTVPDAIHLSCADKGQRNHKTPVRGCRYEHLHLTAGRWVGWMSSCVT